MLIKQRGRVFDLQAPEGLKFGYAWKKGLGLFADKSFKAGDIVLEFEADIVDEKDANPEAFRLDETRCLDTEWLVPEVFINHSCAPNTAIDVENFRYVAIRDITKDEEITFDYNATDYDEGEGFLCACGSQNCYEQVRGFKYLDKKQKLELRPYLSPYIARKFQEEI